jgi:hypothetical protein
MGMTGQLGVLLLQVAVTLFILLSDQFGHSQKMIFGSLQAEAWCTTMEIITTTIAV